MAHQQKFKERAIERLIRDLAAIDPNDLEYCAYALTQLIENRPLVHRGLSVKGRPVGYTVDIFSLDHGVIAECSAEAGYFDDGFAKVCKDIDHARAKNPDCARLYLYSTELCPNGQWDKLLETIAQKSFGHCVINVYDARLAATAIFEKVVEANNQLDQLADFLPCLRQLFDEYIFEQGAPPRPPDFVSDAARLNALADALAVGPIINLCGLSGSGKTYAAIDYLASHGAAYAATLWLSGDDLEGVTDLRAIPVQRLGTKLNLAYQLKEHGCLLVIDSYESDFRALAGLLQNNLHPQTRVLITSQLKAPNLPNCELPELSDTPIETLLSDCPTPPSVADVTGIIETVGRHPLVLAVLRDTVRENPSLTWPLLLSDIKVNLGGYETSRNQTIITHVLGRHQAGIATELLLLRWLDSALMDARFVERFLGIPETQKLFRRSILKPADRAYVRLHDLIRICLNRFEASPPNDFRPEQRFWNYFEQYWETSPYHFQRSLHLHRVKVEQAIDPEHPTPGLAVYLCLLLRGGVPSASGLDSLAAASLESHRTDVIAAGCIVEAIEKQWQRDREDSFLRSGIERITAVLGTNPTDAVRLDLLHHRGKFHRWLKQWPQAETDFEAVLAVNRQRWSARLQLARVLRARKKDGAATHLNAIYDAFESDHSAVPSTVMLAALSELGVEEHRNLRDTFLRDRMALLKHAIALSLVEGFSQPYQVLGRIGRHLFYRHPQVLIELVAEVGFPMPDDAATEERFEIAECLKFIGKAHGEKNCDAAVKHRWYHRAVEYYERVSRPNQFHLTMWAECCILVEEFRNAREILRRVPEDERGPHWWHRFAQANRGLGCIDDALDAITNAIEMLEDNRFRSAFLLERAEIEALQGHPSCMETLREAYDLASDEKFKQQLSKRRIEFESQFAV